MNDHFPPRLATLLPLFEKAGMGRDKVSLSEIASYVFRLLNAEKPTKYLISNDKYQETLEDFKKLIAFVYEIKGQYFKSVEKDGEDILTQSRMLGWALYPIMIHKILFLVKDILKQHPKSNTSKLLSMHLNLLNSYCALYDRAFINDTLLNNLYAKVTQNFLENPSTLQLLSKAKQLNHTAWKKIKKHLNNNNNFKLSNELHIPFSIRQSTPSRPGHYIEIILKEIEGTYYALIYNTSPTEYGQDHPEQTQDLNKIQAKITSLRSENKQQASSKESIKKIRKLEKYHQTLLDNTKLFTSSSLGSIQHHTQSTISTKPVYNKDKLIKDGNKVFPAVLTFSSQEDAINYTKLLNHASLIRFNSTEYHIMLQHMIYEPGRLQQSQTILASTLPKELLQYKIKSTVLTENQIDKLDLNPLISYDRQKVGNCVYAAGIAATELNYSHISKDLDARFQKHLADLIKHPPQITPISSQESELFPKHSFREEDKSALNGKIPHCQTPLHKSASPPSVFNEIKQQLHRGERINLLIYGPPYTGKTTLAKYLLECLSKINYHPICLDMTYLPAEVHNPLTKNPSEDSLMDLTWRAFTAMLTQSKEPSPLLVIRVKNFLSSQQRFVFFLDNLSSCSLEPPIQKWLKFCQKQFNTILTNIHPIPSETHSIRILPLTKQQQVNWILNSGLPKRSHHYFTQYFKINSPFLKRPYGMMMLIKTIEENTTHTLTSPELFLSYIQKITTEMNPVKHVDITLDIIKMLKKISHISYQQCLTWVSIQELYETIPGIPTTPKMREKSPLHQYLDVASKANLVIINSQDHTVSLFDSQIKTYIMALNFVDTELSNSYHIQHLLQVLTTEPFIELFVPMVTHMLQPNEVKSVKFLKMIIDNLPNQNPLDVVKKINSLMEQLPQNTTFLKTYRDQLCYEYGISVRDSCTPMNTFLPVFVPAHIEHFIEPCQGAPSWYLQEDFLKTQTNLVKKPIDQWLKSVKDTLSSAKSLRHLRHILFPESGYPTSSKTTLETDLRVNNQNTYSIYALALVLDHNHTHEELLPWLLMGFFDCDNIEYNRFFESYQKAILMLSLREEVKSDCKKIILQAIHLLTLDYTKNTYNFQNNEDKNYLLHSLVNYLIEFGLYDYQTLKHAFNAINITLFDDTNYHEYNVKVCALIANIKLYNPKLITRYADEYYQQLWKNIFQNLFNSSLEEEGNNIIHQQLRELLPKKYFEKNEPIWQQRLISTIKQSMSNYNLSRSLKEKNRDALALFFDQKDLVKNLYTLLTPLNYQYWIAELSPETIVAYYCKTTLKMIHAVNQLQVLKQNSANTKELNDLDKRFKDIHDIQPYLSQIISTEMELCTKKGDLHHWVDYARQLTSLSTQIPLKDSTMSQEEITQAIDCYDNIHLLIPPYNPMAKNTLYFLSSKRIKWVLDQMNEQHELLTEMIKQALLCYDVNSFKACRSEVSLTLIYKFTQILTQDTLPLDPNDKLDILLYNLNILLRTIVDTDAIELHALTHQECDNYCQLIEYYWQIPSDDYPHFRKQLKVCIDENLPPLTESLYLENPYTLRFYLLTHTFEKSSGVIDQFEGRHHNVKTRSKNITLLNKPITLYFSSSFNLPRSWKKTWMSNMTENLKYLTPSWFDYFISKLETWVSSPGQCADIVKQAFTTLLQLDSHKATQSMLLRYQHNPTETTALFVHTNITFNRSTKTIEGKKLEDGNYDTIEQLITKKTY